MKIAKLLPLLAVLALAACNHKHTQNIHDGTEDHRPTEVPVNTGDTDSPKAEKPFQAVSFQKTACFGKCPVYTVKFFSDGTATWYGKMNVDRMGHYEARLADGTLKAIREKAYAIGYFDFYEEYPTEHKVADLPSTITSIRTGDVIKSVKNTHDGPDALADFEKYLSDIIEKLNWQVVEKE